MATWRAYFQKPSVNCTILHWTMASMDSEREYVYRDYGRVVMTFKRERGGHWHLENQGMWPVVPEAVDATVTRVTFLGRPKHDNITPGLYEVGAASANVERNGEHLKMELTAPTIDAAKELYRKVLQNDATIRTVSYETAA